ncbi:MAG: hypothetical protein OHK0039_20480 [Bacteroidia bacterium]
MNWGIDHIKDALEVLSFLATIVGGIAILLAVRDYAISRKHLNFAALESCISRFRQHYICLDAQSDPQLVQAYLDFINEELFYFEHGYLPLGVAADWLDGMAEHVPVLDASGRLCNAANCLPQLRDSGWLDHYRYRRVRSVFTVSVPIDWAAVQQGAPTARAQLASALTNNLRRRRRGR